MPATGDPRALLLSAIGEAFGQVLSAMMGVTASPAAASRPAAPSWVVDFRVSGAASGQAWLGFSDADAAEMARRVMGFDETPPDEAVADTMQELSAQVAGVVSEDPAADGMRLAIGTVSHTGRKAEGWTVVELAFDADFAPLVAIDGQLAARVEQPPRPAPPPADAGSNLDVILDIELPLTVRFGETEMTLHSLVRLGPGSVIDLNRSPDDPVDVMVNGKTIARGEVVVVSGNYGVRVTEVLSAADRIRTMGA